MINKIKVIQMYKVRRDSIIHITVDFDKKGFFSKNCFGIYFIYDKNDILVYIGKSLNNMYKRSFQSAKERGMENDFGKIEYFIPKTKSDTNIYELYYISKYKPKFNYDSNEYDETTIELPKLDIKKTIYNKNKYIEITSYTNLFKIFEIPIETYNNNKEMYIVVTKENIEKINKNIGKIDIIENTNHTLNEYLKYIEKKYNKYKILFGCNYYIDTRIDKINYILYGLYEVSNIYNLPIDKTFESFYKSLKYKYRMKIEEIKYKNSYKNNYYFSDYTNEELDKLVNIVKDSINKKKHHFKERKQLNVQ